MSIRTVCNICNKLRKIDPSIPKYGCQKHKERKYEAVIWINNKQKTKVLPSKTLAEEWESNLSSQIRRGTYHEIEPITVIQMVEKWLAEQDPEIEFHVKKSYEDEIKRHIVAILGESTKISSIRREDIAKIRDKIKNKSSWLRKRINRFVKGIFRLALHYEYVSKDVTTEPMGKKRFKKVRREDIIPVIFNPPQLQHFFNTCRAYNKLYFKISIFAGIRPEETCALNDDSIDAKNNRIIINQCVRWSTNGEEREFHKGQRFRIKPELKSLASYRAIPITKELMEEITFHQLQRQANPQNLLFVTSKGTPFNPCIKAKEFKIDCLKAKETMPDFPILPPYKLRHTFCSLLISRGTDLMIVKELMGHADMHMIDKIYGHVMRYKKDYSAIAKELQNYILDSNSQNTHIYSNKQVQDSNL